MNKTLLQIEDRQLIIFDDVYSAADRERLYHFCSTRHFTTDGSDTARLEYKGDFNLYCNLLAGNQLQQSNSYQSIINQYVCYHIIVTK
jgi:hypothetical protein